MKLEKLNIDKFKAYELKSKQLISQNGQNEVTGSGATIHTSQGKQYHVNYEYDVIRWNSGGIKTYHGFSNYHEVGEECEYIAE